MSAALAVGPNALLAQMDDDRHARLAELRRQLNELNARGRATAPGSPERDAVLAEWEPVHAALMALQDELDEDG